MKFTKFLVFLTFILACLNTMAHNIDLQKLAEMEAVLERRKIFFFFSKLNDNFFYYIFFNYQDCVWKICGHSNSRLNKLEKPSVEKMKKLNPTTKKKNKHQPSKTTSRPKLTLNIIEASKKQDLLIAKEKMIQTRNDLQLKINNMFGGN